MNYQFLHDGGFAAWPWLRVLPDNVPHSIAYPMASGNLMAATREQVALIRAVWEGA